MITKNQWRYANKPMEISIQELRNLYYTEKGEWLATLKADGYRTLLDFTDNVGSPWSRRDLTAGGPVLHPINLDLQNAIEQFKIDNNIKEGSRFDCEWCARRQGSKSEKSSLTNEELIIFGIYYDGDTWVGNKTEEERWNHIKNLKYNNYVKLVESNEDYIKLFEKSMTDYKYEGIVLKHKASTIIIDNKSCVKNPLWLKVKWRGYDDGLTII